MSGLGLKLGLGRYQQGANVNPAEPSPLDDLANDETDLSNLSLSASDVDTWMNHLATLDWTGYERVIIRLVGNENPTSASFDARMTLINTPEIQQIQYNQGFTE